MQKILSTLTATFLINSAIAPFSATPFIETKTSSKNLASQQDKLFLDVPRVAQIGADYCVPASLISIFSYWGWEKDKTQSQIYQEARIATKTPVSEMGVVVCQELADYMNTFIQETTGQVAGYTFNGLDATLGVSLDDIAVFSTYVWNSLSVNVPILMAMHSFLEVGHAVVLCGYEESLDNHWYDKYIIMDPANGELDEILAMDLHQSFKYGFELLGYGEMVPPKDGLAVDVIAFNKELKDIPGNNSSFFVDEIWLNLTKATGITDFSYFTTAFSGLELPDFHSEIKKVNDDPDVRDYLEFNSQLLPDENVDYWASEKEIVHSYSETIGCETIKTWISLSVLIERELNNDLILNLQFYAGAKVTKDKNFQDSLMPYELRGRVKINSGFQVILRRDI